MIAGFGFRSQALALVAALLTLPPAFAGARTLQSGRLVITVQEPFTVQDEKDLLQAMKGGMQVVEDFLGKGRETVTLRVYARTADFTSANGVPWWVGGVLMGEEIRIQSVRVLRSKKILGSTLTHEYAHLVMKEVTGGRGPKWIEEGTAIFLAREFTANPPGKRPWTALEKGLARPFVDKDTSFRAYHEARGSVEYLVRTYGREKYLNLLESLRIGKDLDGAMKEAFGKSLQEVETGYLKS
jgi:Peptidase MA superfamily